MTDDRAMLSAADYDRVRDRLVNFARWSRSGGGGAATCYSVEGRYRPELLRGDEESDRRTPLPEIDVRDALLVFRAVGPAHGFPTRLFLALSAAYIWRLTGWQFAGYMRRHRHAVSRRDADIDALIHEATLAAGVAIRRQEVARAYRLGYSSTRANGGMVNEPGVGLLASNTGRGHH